MARSLFLEKDSPVDFLYIDRNRVASLIGQLSDRGVLVGLRSVLGKSVGKEGTAGGSIAIAKAEGKASTTHSESAEETYDPFWTHAYSFLRDLETDFAVPLEQARLGSLVKFEALIQFVDLRIMSSLWEPTAEAFLQSQAAASPGAGAPMSRKHRREQRQQSAPETKALRTALEVLKGVPHLLNLTFATRSGISLWAAAQPEHLTIGTGDLVMKYGAVIDGLWTVVGIVDGLPGGLQEPMPVSALLDGVMAGMANLRELCGRPTGHWGLTPIAIYAPLRGAAEAESQVPDAPADPDPAEPPQPL